MEGFFVGRRVETTIYKQTKREKDLLRQGHSPIGGSSEGLIMQIFAFCPFGDGESTCNRLSHWYLSKNS